jgi:hypothetical protein
MQYLWSAYEALGWFGRSCRPDRCRAGGRRTVFTMAKVRLNPVMEQFRGKVGDLVFKRFADEVIVTRNPDREGLIPTPGQLAHRERFRLAALYGKAVFAEPSKKAIYEEAAKAKGIPVFSLTVADFFNAPVVDEIDLSGYTGKAGEPIGIRAHDDFEVNGVAVAIRNLEGMVLEQGAAAKQSNGVWRYVTTSTLPIEHAVSIEVTASDRPGNKTVKTQAKT